jgi:hypothetical protein
LGDESFRKIGVLLPLASSLDTLQHMNRFRKKKKLQLLGTTLGCCGVFIQFKQFNLQLAIFIRHLAQHISDVVQLCNHLLINHKVTTMHLTSN